MVPAFICSAFGWVLIFLLLFYGPHARCHFPLLSQQPAYLFLPVFSGYCTLSFFGSLSLCFFLSHLAGPISAKMCTFTWINRLFNRPKQPSVQKDGQLSTSSSSNTFATRERCRFRKQCLLFPCSCPWGPIKMDSLYPLIWSAYAVRLFFLPYIVCSWFASIFSWFICLLSVLGTAVSIFLDLQ